MIRALLIAIILIKFLSLSIASTTRLNGSSNNYSFYSEQLKSTFLTPLMKNNNNNDIVPEHSSQIFDREISLDSSSSSLSLMDSDQNLLLSDEFSIESASKNSPNSKTASSSNEGSTNSIFNKSYIDINSFFDNDRDLSYEENNNNEFDSRLESSGTDEDDPYKVYSLPAKIVLSILASSASLITICGNLLVMCSFFLDRQIRNPTNYFILSLSISDFLIGLVSIPFLTLYIMIGKWPFGQVICNLWLSMDYTVCLTSIYTVLFITIDRFCSVKMPAKYRKWRTPNKIIIMILITWIVPCSLFFTSIFGWSYGTNKPFDPRNCDVAWASNKIFSVTLVFSYFWSTLIIIIILYVFIYQVARNLEKKSRDKHRKLSSLVGASATNTGALVSVVALAVNKQQNPNDTNNNSNSNKATILMTNNIKKSANFNQGGGDQTPDDMDDEDTINSRQSLTTRFYIGGLLNRKKRKNMMNQQNNNSKLNFSILNKGNNLGSSNTKTANNNASNTGMKNSTSGGKFNASKIVDHNKNNSKAKNANQTEISSQAPPTTTSIQDSSNSMSTGGVHTASTTNQFSNNSKGKFQQQSQKKQSNLNQTNNNNNNNAIKKEKNSFFGKKSNTQYSLNDDASSSYESHSDFDNSINQHSNSNNNTKKSLLTVQTKNLIHGKNAPSLNNQNKDLPKPQPRPESLAIMSHDLFVEKCASVTSMTKLGQSSNVRIFCD